MVLKRKLDGKGRLQIPADVLEQLNIPMDEVVNIDIDDGKIIITRNIEYNNVQIKKVQ